jgi:hypothetical protein
VSKCWLIKYLFIYLFTYFRNNPITSHFYSKALLPASGHAAKSYVAIVQDKQWLKEDDSFSMSMEKHWRERRNIYRALLIKDCSYLVELDHIPIEPQERDQSHLIVEDYVNLFNTTENTFVE